MGAVIAGFAAGRLARGAQRANTDGSSDPTAVRNDFAEDPSIGARLNPKYRLAQSARQVPGHSDVDEPD